MDKCVVCCGEPYAIISCIRRHAFCDTHYCIAYNKFYSITSLKWDVVFLGELESAEYSKLHTSVAGRHTDSVGNIRTSICDSWSVDRTADTKILRKLKKKGG